MDPSIQNHLIDQNWASYTNEQHDIWKTLFHRQHDILQDRAVPEFLYGVDHLEIAPDKIPDFDELSDILTKATGWKIVAVEGLVPDDIFFTLLANRCFPSTCFIRRMDQLDYLQEPDIFHDIYGHVPLLIQPVFADYMEAYGKAGLRALGNHSLHYLARLYWYTVEFGLIDTPKGLRIYGSGIVSSAGESKYCLESPKPNRLWFDSERVMRTNYKIDDYQEIYFVVSSLDDLIKTTTQDFMETYELLKHQADFEPNQVLLDDRRYR
ncbi:MAG: phenylalanine 4-monooxygenase [Alphaproteobacteria bacterium]|nr:phenylalanine 4-monooxygenase [Alphaproteobacteria bacterium]